MYAQALSATLKLLLFRVGPEDFPYGDALVRVTIPITLLAYTMLFSLMLPIGLAAVIGLAMIAALAVSTRSILRMRKFENRFQQTFNALLATGAALTLAQVPLFAQIAPEMMKVMQEMQQASEGSEIIVRPESARDMSQISAVPVFLLNLLSFWSFLVQAHIFRHGTGVSYWVGGLIALLVSLISLFFAVFGGSVVAALLGGGAAVTP